MRRHVFVLVLILAVLPAVGFLAYVTVLAYSAWRRPATDPSETLRSVPDFALTERSGRTVRLNDVRGKVWVASFVFTRCAGACSQITETMARLQKELGDQPEVLLVSISVDPKHDTPAVLKDYAGRFGADPERWLFLTGEQDDVYRLVSKGFALGVQQTEGAQRTPGNEVIHSSKLALVDRQSRIRGYFDGRQADDDGRPIDDLPRLRQAIAELLREES